MRGDVKLGMIISLVVVLGVGGYYLFRDNWVSSIPLSNTPVASTDSGKKTDRPQPSGNLKTAQPQPKLGPRPAPPQKVIIPPQGTIAATQAPGSTAPADAVNTPRPTPGGAPSTAQPVDARIAARPTVPPGNQPTGMIPTGPNRPMPVANDASRANPVTGGSVPEASLPEQNVAMRSVEAGKTPTPSVPMGDSTVSSNPPIGTSAPQVTDLTASTPASRFPAGATTTLTQEPARVSPQGGAVETHRVQPGDTLASLAQTYYGSEKYMPVLLDSNPGLGNPPKLPVGTVVRIPPQPASPPAPRAVPAGPDKVATSDKAPAGKRTYRVRHGDSFYAIARDELGDASRWKELLALNSNLVKGDPTRLRIGQIVVLPES